MAARGGLNKGRGLGALIPNKLQETEIKAPGSSKSEKDSSVSKVEKKQVTEEKSQLSDTLQSQKEEQKLSAVEETEGVLTVRLAQVVPNQMQPRKKFEDDSIRELADSIQKFGVLQPLLVQKKGKYFEIIAGERRWRAAKEAGLKEIPVIVRDFKEPDAVAISLIENIQREDLNPLEEAKAYERLIHEFGLTQSEVASRVAKSRTAVTNTMRLLKLTPEVQNYLIDGKLTMGHARALLSLEEAEIQRTAADQIVEKELSVRETEKLVKELLNPKQKPEKKTDPQKEAVYRKLEEQLRRKTGTRVSIRQKGRQKGKIEIEYYSDEDLDRIVTLIGGGSL